MQIKFYKVPVASANQVLGARLKEIENAGTTFIMTRVSGGDDRLNQGIFGITGTNSTEMSEAIAPAGPIRDEWKKRLDAMAGS